VTITIVFLAQPLASIDFKTLTSLLLPFVVLA